MTTFLVEHPWVAPTALLVLVVAGPLLGRWLLGHPPAVAWWAFGGSLVGVALLTLTPVRRELFARCAFEWAVPTFGRVELIANVVLFVLPVLLASVALRRSVVALLAGVGASAGIEALQAAARGIGRSCSTNDWLANAIGAAIGAGLAWGALAWSRRAADTGALGSPSAGAMRG